MNQLKHSNEKDTIKIKKTHYNGKKHHCKRESENIQCNKLNNIYNVVERVIDQIVTL
jgi:hypothetical protein